MKRLSDLPKFQEDQQEILSSVAEIKKEQELDQGDEARPIFIPGFVVANHDIPSGAKLVFGRVVGLSKKRGFCWASNEEIGRPINYKRESVKSYLGMLYKLGYLVYTTVRDTNTKQVIERRIYPTLGYYNTLPLGDNNTLPGVSKPPNSISNANALSNVNKEEQERAIYYAGLLAGILHDEDSMSFYISACLQNDPPALLQKAKEISQDGAARSPGAVFTAWLKTRKK